MSKTPPTFFVEYIEKNGFLISTFEYRDVEADNYELLKSKIESYFKDKYGDDTIVNITKAEV